VLAAGLISDEVLDRKFKSRSCSAANTLIRLCIDPGENPELRIGRDIVFYPGDAGMRPRRPFGLIFRSP